MKTAKDVIMNIITEELGDNFAQKEKISNKIVKQLHLENVKIIELITEVSSLKFNHYE